MNPHTSDRDRAASASAQGVSNKGSAAAKWLRWPVRLIGLAAAAGFALLCGVALALAVAYPNLPDVSDLRDYRPAQPLRIFSADKLLIGEFGEERRNVTRIDDIPQVMKDAVLAIEDSRFYQHSGVDYIGVARAALANLGRLKSQGASTITMQVARNVYLSSERTFTRKIYEVLLTFKLEHSLTKDQILEIYMNQIFLGNRSYGFAAACESYFGKPLSKITVAEAALLAGLPKAPSAFNPLNNPNRARSRQLHIIEQMEEKGFITAEQATQAKEQPIKLRTSSDPNRAHAEFVAEMARQLVFAQYGEEAYSRGLHVYTTIDSSDQAVAYRALRRGIMDYERRQVYRGPEKFATLPTDPKALTDKIDELLEEHPDNGDVMAAVVLEASATKVVAVRQNAERIEVTGEGLRPVQSGLSDRAPPNIKIRPGAVVRVAKLPKGGWELTQLPEVEGAFVAIDSQSGAIRALVGGFDFQKNKFNHVTQAWRQPGSSFKPFIYSAALERGFTAKTLINDAPIFFGSSVTGGQPWEPKNYDGKFDGPMSLKTGLAKSKNMVSIRVIHSITAAYAQRWVTQFGFEEDKHPPYLTMALGAGSVTPMQMANAYAVFANGGYRTQPWLITRITDPSGRVLVESPSPSPKEADRAIDTRNAFVMKTLLGEVTRAGTAARAQATLQRADVYGKTGTTNDSRDAWFAGFQPKITAVAWIGYDTPRKLGDRETGGGLALPVWITYMQHALKNVPVEPLAAPAGVVLEGGDWLYEEFARGNGVAGVGLDEAQAGPVTGADGSPVAPAGAPVQGLPAADEKKSILEMFRN